MEFLDNNLTKESSLLLHAIHSAFYWRILKKTILVSGFKKPYKKSAKQENERKTRAREDSSLCQETSTKNAVQEFHLRFSI
jgi:hypothetical protein